MDGEKEIRYFVGWNGNDEAEGKVPSIATVYQDSTSGPSYPIELSVLTSSSPPPTTSI